MSLERSSLINKKYVNKIRGILKYQVISIDFDIKGVNKMIFKSQYEEIKKVAEDIYYHPELGYKEERTKEKIVASLKQMNPDIQIEEFSTTGFKTTLGVQSKDLHVAFIAELDAVYAPSHMYADKNTGAAHNCGHYTQVAIALALYNYLVKSNVYKDFDYKISFIFRPCRGIFGSSLS